MTVLGAIAMSRKAARLRRSDPGVPACPSRQCEPGDGHVRSAGRGDPVGRSPGGTQKLAIQIGGRLGSGPGVDDRVGLGLAEGESSKGADVGQGWGGLVGVTVVVGVCTVWTEASGAKGGQDGFGSRAFPTAPPAGEEATAVPRWSGSGAAAAFDTGGTVFTIATTSAAIHTQR